MPYAFVNNGEIHQTFASKPRGIGNISFSSTITDEELKSYGIFFVERSVPSINPLYQRFEWSEPYIDGATVKQNAIISEITIDELRQRLKDQTASDRYNVEVGGITYKGKGIHTDRESQGKLTGMYALATTGAINTLTYKTKDGFINLISSEEIISLCAAVSQHVQACYAREAEIVSQLDAAESVEALLAVEDF